MSNEQWAGYASRQPRSPVQRIPLAESDREGHELCDITQHEIVALQTRFNLADAHTHQHQSPTQRQIVARLPHLWYAAEETTQIELEKKFIKNFFDLHGQPTALGLGRTMLFYAASIAMLCAGMYFKRQGLSVSLVDPCFDNLHDILRNLQVPLIPLREEWLHGEDQVRANLETAATGDVICLVDPNNPTGFTLLKHGRRGFEQLIEFCKANDKILMLDLCFASFALMDPTFGRFDLYEMLEGSGVSYVAIEDTGKTWPLQDAKCALLTVSGDLHSAVYNIHTSILLNVSPFILNMLSEYLVDSAVDQFASVRDLLRENRNFLRAQLAQCPALEYCDPVLETSVSWLRVRDPKLNAAEVQRRALSQNVYVLPGTYFHWSRHSVGERYIRIALAREPAIFRAAVLNLRNSVDG